MTEAEGRVEPEVDVLIVGGGISGLTLALQLHQHGTAAETARSSGRPAKTARKAA